jgi:hypothetical protein
MWDLFRVLTKKNVADRQRTAARRFGVEPLEHRLNLSSGAGSGTDAAIIALRLGTFDSTPLAPAYQAVIDAGTRGLDIQPSSGPQSGPVAGHLTAAPDRGTISRPLNQPSVLAAAPTRARNTTIVVEVRFEYYEPTRSAVPEEPDRSTQWQNFFAQSVSRTPPPSFTEAPYHAQAPIAKPQVGPASEIALPNLVATTDDATIESSYRPPASTAPEPTTTSAFSSLEPRGDIASQSDEGGMIDIRGIGSQKAAPGLSSDPTESPRDGVSEEKISDHALSPKSRLEIEQTNAAIASADDRPSALKLHESPPLLAFADGGDGEGGMIDLAQVSTVHAQLPAEHTPIIVADAESDGRPATTEVIQVDSAVGLYRAFELATTLDGEFVVPTDSPPTLPALDDSETETPVSTGIIDVDPAVSGAAAAIPAVLIVANWAHATRRKKRKKDEAQSDSVHREFPPHG